MANYVVEGDTKALVGSIIPNAILNVAHSLINSYTKLRWETVTETLLFSGNGKTYKYLNMPISSVTSVTEKDNEGEIETVKTVYTDYDFIKEIGKIRLFEGFIPGYNNWEIVYAYGYDNTQKDYGKIVFAEATIGLMLKKNPLLLTQITLTGGDKLMFDSGSGGGASQVVRNLMVNLGIPVNRLVG